MDDIAKFIAVNGMEVWSFNNKSGLDSQACYYMNKNNKWEPVKVSPDQYAKELRKFEI